MENYKKDIVESIRKTHEIARESERKRIIDYIAKQKDEKGKPLFCKVNGNNYESDLYRGGKGVTYYGKNRFKNNYDLSNWKYIETKYKNKYVFISLQSFDIDPKEKNIHVLYDRIGIFIGEKEPKSIKLGNIAVSPMFKEMIVTEYQLPLSDNDIQSLIMDIKNQIDCTI